jgi:uncharacterized protein
VSIDPQAARIRDLAPADLAGALALNNESAVEVNALTADELARQVGLAAASRYVDGGLGLLIAFDETTPPIGPNHAWFLERLPAFLYIDRVVIARSARGRGLGRRLYQDLFERAAGRPLCCEVNVDPPNPGSLAFHERLGFSAQGEAVDPRNGKCVRYFVR